MQQTQVTAAFVPVSMEQRLLNKLKMMEEHPFELDQCTACERYVETKYLKPLFPKRKDIHPYYYCSDDCKTRLFGYSGSPPKKAIPKHLSSPIAVRAPIKIDM